MRQFGGHLISSGAGTSLYALLPPERTAEAAEATATAKVKKDFPPYYGTYGDVVALVKWTDHGTWSGVINSYYSDS